MFLVVNPVRVSNSNIFFGAKVLQVLDNNGPLNYDHRQYQDQ